MHMRIQLTGSGQYILGQFSRPFNSIAEMVNYYTVSLLSAALLHTRLVPGLKIYLLYRIQFFYISAYK